ncbi:hypothetical protein SALCHL_000930 [Streptomyces albus subsp. chlorinus]|uniref:hypothetical protein n=1 Tax=Streptomyces albus TaxID=1888 RepID=UPI0015714F42|nr:hypothetical protein [Streptomyces albus]
MPSVVELIEERELVARQRVESLRDEVDRLVTELKEAESMQERLAIAKETVSRVLSESGRSGVVQVPEAAGPTVPEPAVRLSGKVPGSAVPVRQNGLAVTALSPDYQRIMHILAFRETPMICRQIAEALGLEPVPAKIEGVRSKAKRLAARGWLAENLNLDLDSGMDVTAYLGLASAEVLLATWPTLMTIGLL